MPHKRAKRSKREQQRSQLGEDLVPGVDDLLTEAVPKSAARVINATKVRAQWREKRKAAAGREMDGDGRRKRRKVEGGEDGAEKKQKDKLVIRPGETLQRFSRRVEEDMQPLVRAAMKSCATTTKVARRTNSKRRKAKLSTVASKSAAESDPEAHPGGWNRPQQDFPKLSTSSPRRLNDIAQAPPKFSKLPKGAPRNRDKNISVVRRAMMEREREMAVAKYRKLKERRAQMDVSRDTI